MIGRKIIFRETLDSTNNYAANLLERGELSHGTVIMSGEQTAGRGQRGTTWISEPYKNLIFTCFIEYDNLAVANQQSITHFVSLSLVDMLSEKGLDARIKWPNDIYVGGRKLSGMLIENQLESFRCKSSIIGIGLNVNQVDFGDFPATSLKLELGYDLPVDDIALSLISHLNTRFASLRSYGLASLEAAYLEKLWRKDVWSDFEDGNGPFEGKIIGTESSGKLVVERKGGIKTYDLKEIMFR